MKIDSSFTSIYSGLNIRKSQGAGSIKELKSSEGVKSPFSLQLTNMVTRLSDIKPSSGEIRPEKVAEISRRLADGSYNISGQAVAEKMLAVLKV